MGEDNLVSLEGGLVHETAGENVHHIEGVVLQVVPRVRGHRLVVLIDRVEGRVRVLRHKGGRAHQHEAAILGEEGTLPVQLLVAGRYGHGEPQLEESIGLTCCSVEFAHCRDILLPYPAAGQPQLLDPEIN